KRTDIAADPDRAAAEWALSVKEPAFVEIGVDVGGASRALKRGNPLPVERFRVTGIYILNGDSTASDVADVALARHLPGLNLAFLTLLGWGERITDASLEALRTQKALLGLAIMGNRLSPAACLELAKGLPKLQTLHIDTRQFSAGLAQWIHKTPQL